MVEPIRIIWEGHQIIHRSLAVVNRELCLSLLDLGCEISIIPSERDKFDPSCDEDFLKLKRCMYKKLLGPPDIYVRHQWPPVFMPPNKGHWVIIQPWEYGSLPKSWVEGFSSQVDEIWVPSNYVKEVYIDSGISPERVQVIPNGVNPKKFYLEVSSIKLDTEKGFKFLFVGGTVYRKGVDTLLSAYINAFDKSDDVCLVIKDHKHSFPNQTTEEEIRETSKRKDIPEVLYLDRVLPESEMPGLYASCDVLVHPYRGEGFGLPILEAMACGVPVIVTNGGACLDFCNSKNSLLVKAEKKELSYREISPKLETVKAPWLFEVDSKDLQDKMVYAYQYPKEMKSLGQKVSEGIRSDWSWDRAAEKIVSRVSLIKKNPVRRSVVKKLFILTPKYLDYTEETKASIRKAKKELKGRLEIICLSRSDAEIVVNRTHLFDRMKQRYKSGKPFDYILWVDTDIAFEPSCIESGINFIESGQGHCLAGDHIGRYCRMGSMAWKGSEEEGVLFDDPHFEWELDKYHEVYVAGFGFFMLSREAAIKYWEAYKFPEFFTISWQWNPTEKVWQYLGEDINFCLKMRKIGFSIWLDTHVRINHNGITRFNYRDKEIKRDEKRVIKEEI